MHGSSERDQSIERLLKHSLKTPTRDGATGACLDAETLAAWTDGGLTGHALEAAQLHVADCSRCQELAGTLARITGIAPQPEPVPVSRRWLAWFVPLTAAAAALAIWIAVPDRNALVRPAAAPQRELQGKAAEPKPVEPHAAEPQPKAPTPAPPLDRRSQVIGGQREADQQSALAAPEAATKDLARGDSAQRKSEAGNNADAGA